MRSKLLLLCALIAANALSAQVAPRRTGSVTDGADILPTELESEISDQCYLAKKASRCEVLVVTAFTQTNYTVEEHAAELLALMQPTAKRRDNTALLLVTANPDDVLERPTEAAVVAGFGLQGVLPDHERRRIVVAVADQLRSNSTADAVKTGTKLLIDRIAPGALIVTAPSLSARQDSSSIVFVIGALVILGIGGLLAAGVLWGLGRRCRECKGKMEVVSEKVIAEPAGGRRGLGERVWECRRCDAQKLEKFLTWPEKAFLVDDDETLDWLGRPKSARAGKARFAGGTSGGAGAGANW